MTQADLHTHILRGSIEILTEYKIGTDWSTYQERIWNNIFLANYVEEDRKVAVLLTVIGDQAYETLKGLCDPILPKDKSYSELCRILKNQYSKKISVFKERIEFYEIKQFENESVKDYYVRQKNKAIECKFGASLNEVLKDKLVSGLKRGPILDRVCEEEHTEALDRILEISLKKEAAVVASYSQLSVNKLTAYQKRNAAKKKKVQRKKKTKKEVKPN